MWRARCNRMTRAGALVAALASAAPIVMLQASDARAAGSDETLAAGLNKFEEGRKAFEAGQFEEALIDFKASLELLPSPNTRLYMGRCYRALGKTASAFTALKFAASEAQDRLTTSNEKRYAATRDVANQEAADLEAHVPRLTVAVPANPPAGFSVKVGGKELPQAAWGAATETDPGEVVVEATGPRLLPFKKSVTLKDGSRERVDVALNHMPTATLAVRLKSLPSGLSLTIDGKPVDVGGVDAPRDLDVGVHEIVVNAPGYFTFKWSHSLSDAEAETVEVDLKPNVLAGRGGSSGTPKWIFFSVAGAALVAGGVGAGIAVSAQNQQNQQLKLDPFQRDSAIKSSIQSQALWTDIVFTGSGLLAAGAVVLAFTTHWKSDEAPAVAVAPWIGPGAGGIGANGRF